MEALCDVMECHRFSFPEMTTMIMKKTKKKIVLKIFFLKKILLTSSPNKLGDCHWNFSLLVGTPVLDALGSNHRKEGSHYYYQRENFDLCH